MRHLLKTIGLIGAGWLLVAGAAQAERVVYRPHITTTQWRTSLRETPIQELHVYTRKASGSDTFINMRFGREGHTFDGRRVYLNNQQQTIKASWNLQGRRPEGKELILNAYNGKVYVDRIEVVYQDNRRRDSRRQDYGDRGRNDRRDNYGDDGRYDRGYDRGYDERGRYEGERRYEPDYRDGRYEVYAEHPLDCTCSLHRGESRYAPPPRYVPRQYDDHRYRR